MQKNILAIETSCDETAAAVVSGYYSNINSSVVLQQTCVWSNVVESQIAAHIPFGGVVPEIAARDHLAKIEYVVNSAIEKFKQNNAEQKIDAIAVTMGPGLIGALMVGILFARGLALAKQIPLIAVNHVDAHLAPSLLLDGYTLCTLQKVPDLIFPALALTVSGGHCHLSYLTGKLSRELLGKTLDDACGEAFDKIAKLLGLPYPGGAHIEKMAQTVEKSDFKFPHTLADKLNKYNFSFSGLKTSVLQAIKKQAALFNIPSDVNIKHLGAYLSQEIQSQIAFAFQEAALGQLQNRLANAINDYPESKGIYVAGGVAANGVFRQKMSKLFENVHFAPLPLCSDNAVMIGLHALLLIENENFATIKYDGFKKQAFTRYEDAER